MSVHSQKLKIQSFQLRTDEDDCYERLRFAAASKLCQWHEHQAGKGSNYIAIGDETVGDSLKLRFADHENTSERHDSPDFNFVDRDPTDEECAKIIESIHYPRLCKKTAFAKHVGLTVPKLRKMLPPDKYPNCYEDVCENDYYSNTSTQYVSVAAALDVLQSLGVTERLPVRQESYSEEDYCGNGL